MTAFSGQCSCSDYHCPLVHGGGGGETEKEFQAKLKRFREAEAKFGRRCALPGYPKAEGDDWGRCGYCGQYEAWNLRQNHKCDVRAPLPPNVVRDPEHAIPALPGYYMAKAFGSPAEVRVLDRPYLIKAGDFLFGPNLCNYKSRRPVKMFRGSGRSRKYFIRLYVGGQPNFLISEAAFKRDFEKLPADVIPNGWGGVTLKRKDR